MSNSPKTRASLILRLRSPSDSAAWSEFVEIYQPLVFRLARNKGLQEADALDLTQEVMAKVAAAINQFDPSPDRGSFRGWISTITRNLVIEFLRTENRRPFASGGSSIQQLIAMTPEVTAESRLFDIECEKQIFAWAADRIRGSFQETTWSAFWLTSVDQLGIADAARQLSISTGAVYIARSRVMARLRQQVHAYRQQASSQGNNWIAQQDSNRTGEPS